MEVRARLEGIQHYTIHGGPYARLFYVLPDEPETVLQAQLPAEAFDADLVPGDEIVLTMLLRTVMEIRKVRA
jgi:hypothetical protein